VLCRTLVKRERARAAAPRRRPAAPDEAPAVRIRNPQGFEEVAADEDTAAIELPPLSPTAAASLWDPLPVTLPTYVGKPKATRTVRTIDLSDPGVSSSGRDEADSQLVAEASAAAEPADPDEEQRRAVNS